MARRRSDGPDYRWQSFDGSIQTPVNQDSPVGALFGPQAGQDIGASEEIVGNLYLGEGSLYTADATNFIRSIGNVVFEQDAGVASPRNARISWLLAWTENIEALSLGGEQINQPDTLEDLDVLDFGLEPVILRPDAGLFGDFAPESTQVRWDVASTRVCEPLDAGVVFAYNVAEPSNSGIGITAHVMGRNLVRLD